MSLRSKSLKPREQHRVSEAVPLYKIYNGISPTIMNEILTLRDQNQYNLRN